MKAEKALHTKYSYPHRTIVIWKTLKDKLVEAGRVHSIKANLDKTDMKTRRA